MGAKKRAQLRCCLEVLGNPTNDSEAGTRYRVHTVGRLVGKFLSFQTGPCASAQLIALALPTRTNKMPTLSIQTQVFYAWKPKKRVGEGGRLRGVGQRRHVQAHCPAHPRAARRLGWAGKVPPRNPKGQLAAWRFGGLEAWLSRCAPLLFRTGSPKKSKVKP